MNVFEELQERGCIYLNTGHQFIGVGDDHLDGYCNVDPALPDTRFMKTAAAGMVDPFLAEEVDTVMSAAVGGIPLSQWGADRLTNQYDRRVSAVWADKIDDNELALVRNGFAEQVEGRRVLLLEDAINKMNTIRKLIRVARDAGGIVVGVGSVAANEGVSQEAMDVPGFVTLCRVVYDTWSPEDCARVGPCSEGKKIVVDKSLGHGAEYREKHRNYPGGYINLLKNDS